jgi:hypothetical protein
MLASRRQALPLFRIEANHHLVMLISDPVLLELYIINIWSFSKFLQVKQDRSGPSLVSSLFRIHTSMQSDKERSLLLLITRHFDVNDGHGQSLSLIIAAVTSKCFLLINYKKVYMLASWTLQANGS